MFNISNWFGNTLKEIKPSNRTLGFEHIYVIHLNYREDRREKMDKLVSYLNLDVEYFDAVSKFDKILQKYANENGEVTVGQRACYVTHYLVYHTVIDKGFNNVLILEDDVDFESNITDIMTDIHRNLPESWDTLFLGHCYETRGQLVGNSSFPNQLYKSMQPQCAHAYGISKSGASKILEAIDPMNPRGPIDYEIALQVENEGIISYSVHPQPIIQCKIDNPSDVALTSYYPFVLTNSTMALLGLLNENQDNKQWM
ncbi:35421_t:CDS:1, partial [Racocetra persica]